jgi:hypothetical protein
VLVEELLNKGKCYKRQFFQVLVAHACNPSYSEGRDQKDCDSKPARANSSRHPIPKKNPSQKRADAESQVVERLPSKDEPEFKPQYCQNK